MRFTAIFPLVFALATLWSAASNAQSPASAESKFREGIAAYQKGDDNGARASFEEALKLDPANASILYDLGLTENRAGNKGLALALWRKALVIDPGFKSASQAIAWTKTKLEHSDIPHEVEPWESFRSAALVTTPLTEYLGATAVLLLAAGWLLLRYAGRRRQARLDERPMPGFPTGGTVCAALLAMFLFLSAAKAYDETVPRATVVTKKVEARSSPDASSTALFDLYEGLEVILGQQRDDWIQVTYPGGSTGWIPKNSLFATNEAGRRVP